MDTKLNQEIKFNNCTLKQLSVINNKEGKPIWDMFLLHIDIDDGFAYRNIKVVTEHGIITNNISSDILKKFIVDRVSGENSLIEKQGNREIVFLGTMYKQDNKVKFTRHYTSFYCQNGKTAQQMFDDCYDTIYKSINQVEYNNEEMKKKQKILDRIKKYGITEKEYDSLITYQGSEYFVSNTLLHDVSLVKLMKKEPMGGFLENIDYWNNPRNAIESYCNIYSAMCKFRNIYKGNVQATRSCSLLFKREMEQKHETISLLSFSPNKSKNNRNEYTKYAGQRYENIYLSTNIEENVPFFDYSILYEEHWSPNEENLSEILIPPFMEINYQETNEVDLYYVNISNKNDKFTQNDEDEMTRLEPLVLNKNIIKKYYEKCYYDAMHYPTIMECSDKKLEKEFREWQKQFKLYLKLRFKKISHEILKQQNTSVTLNSKISFLEKLKNELTKERKENTFSMNNHKKH